MKVRLPTQGLLRDTTHLAVGQGTRLVIQAAYFVLVARALGPDRYGAFVTAVAIASVLSPFSGLGTPNIFIKNVRSGLRTAQVCWGNGLLLCVVSGILLSLFAALAALLFRLDVALSVTLTVSIADLVLLKITELSAAGFTALDRMPQTSLQIVIVSGLRLAGIAGLYGFMHAVSLKRWVMTYLAMSFLGALYGIIRGSQCWGRPQVDLLALREDAGEGIFFSIAGSAATIYNDIDKIMLSRLGSLEATGLYAAAYRVIDVSMTPIRSLAAAAYPQFFRKGRKGATATYGYARALVRRSSVYGVFAWAGLSLAAPMLPLFLGNRYAAVVPAVRWLAPIPLLRCIHSFMADALSGAGLQRTRTTIQVVVALANIALNLAILPRYSWRGAAWSSLVCDGLLVVLFWAVAGYHGHRRADAPCHPETNSVAS